MAARAPGAAEAQFAQRQVHVITDDEHILNRAAALVHRPGDGHAAPVHEGLRAQQQNGLAADASLPLDRAEAPAPQADAAVAGERAHDHEAEVVARPPIAEARIAQAHDDLHCGEWFGGRGRKTCGGGNNGLGVGPPARLERATRALGGPCSIHLSYGGAKTHFCPIF